MLKFWLRFCPKLQKFSDVKAILTQDLQKNPRSFSLREIFLAPTAYSFSFLSISST